MIGTLSTRTSWIIFQIQCCCHCSVGKSCPTLSRLKYARLPCPSLSPRVCPISHLLSQWCDLTISSSAAIFSFCLQSFPASESALCIRWPKYWSFSFSISPSNEYSGLISLGLIGLISLLSKGLSRVFSSTTVQRHQFFHVQPSLWSNSHIHTWLLEKPQFWLYGPLSTKWCLCFLICCLGLSLFFFQGESFF